MKSIAIFSLGNLTEEQKTNFLAISKVGKAEFLESGKNDLYNRLRNINFADIMGAWRFPEQLENEELSIYINRIRVTGIQAFNNLKQGDILAIWLSEGEFNLLSKQPEFIAL